MRETRSDAGASAPRVQGSCPHSAPGRAGALQGRARSVRGVATHDRAREHERHDRARRCGGRAVEPRLPVVLRQEASPRAARSSALPRSRWPPRSLQRVLVAGAAYQGAKAILDDPSQQVAASKGSAVKGAFANRNQSPSQQAAGQQVISGDAVAAPSAAETSASPDTPVGAALPTASQSAAGDRPTASAAGASGQAPERLREAPRPPQTSRRLWWAPATRQNPPPGDGGSRRHRPATARQVGRRRHPGSAPGGASGTPGTHSVRRLVDARRHSRRRPGHTDARRHEPEGEEGEEAQEGEARGQAEPPGQVSKADRPESPGQAKQPDSPTPANGRLRRPPPRRRRRSRKKTRRRNRPPLPSLRRHSRSLRHRSQSRCPRPRRRRAKPRHRRRRRPIRRATATPGNANGHAKHDK